MIKLDQETLVLMDSNYQGFLAHLPRLEGKDIPPCSSCGLNDTAVVQCGVVGRTINLAAATAKFHLLRNQNGERPYFCNSCREYFGAGVARKENFEKVYYRPVNVLPLLVESKQ